MNHTVQLSHGLPVADGRVIPWDQLESRMYQLVDRMPEKAHVAYARVSSGEQAINGCSLQAQVEFAIALAERNGHKLAAVYVDPGKSASKLPIEAREGINQLLIDIKGKRIQTVYVYKRDRLSRSSAEWPHMVKICDSRRVDVLFTCAGEPMMGTGSYGAFTEAIIMAANELEAKITRMRVTENILSRFTNGKWVGGQPPYGFGRDTQGNIVLVPAEAAVIKEVFRLAHEEMLGSLRIVDRINKKFPGSWRGQNWDRPIIEKVLRNRIYCGYMQLDTEIEKDGRPQRIQMERKAEGFPEIVSEEVWQKVADMRAERARAYSQSSQKPPSRYLASSHLLHGLLTCGACGRPMHGRHFVRRHQRKDGSVSECHTFYYLCRKGREGRDCEWRGSVRCHALESEVIQVCNEYLAMMEPAEVLKRAQAYRQSQSEEIRRTLSTMKQELANTNATMEKYDACLRRAKADREVVRFQDKLRELDDQQLAQTNRISSLEEEIRTLTAVSMEEEDIIRALQDWPERFRNAPVEKHRAMLSDVIHQVTWHPFERKVEVTFKFEPTLHQRAVDVLQNVHSGDPVVTFCITKQMPKLSEHLHGKRVGNPVTIPFGLRRDHTGVHVHASESEVVRRVFDLRIGGNTLSAIARRIMMEFRPENRGTRWDHLRVREILQTTWYCGYQRNCGRRHLLNLDDCVKSAVVPPIVDRETWLRAQSVTCDPRDKGNRQSA